MVPLKKGQHYIYDIIGSVVYDLEDHELGKLTDVLRTGSNDVYVVTADDGRETLFAAIPDVVKSVDTEAKRIVVDPPEWGGRMRIDIISLFPELIEAFFQHSIIGRARAAGLLDLDVTNPRNFTYEPSSHGR